MGVVLAPEAAIKIKRMEEMMGGGNDDRHYECHLLIRRIYWNSCIGVHMCISYVLHYNKKITYTNKQKTCLKKLTKKITYINKQKDLSKKTN